ncbi:MAG: asparagine synthase (glutamine-hydrolyzing) [Elusimicrobiota bacterium]
MCGIAGEFRLDGSCADRGAAAAAAAALAHRGPDESGDWAEGPVAFAFRRLSILDLARGQQPMRSPSGRFSIVYNGEIYNHPQLKEELERGGTVYRTHCDTETLLHLYAQEGAAALRRIEGMFAFAVWDAEKHELLLARDPLGIKPLYYHFDGKRLAFASELRALTTLTQERALDPSGVLDYLAYGFTHSPRTVLDSVLKLPPGHLLRVNAHGLAIEKYWEIPPRPPWETRGHGGRGPGIGEAMDQVERLLIASVRGQLMSDVPVGAFLSGGVDSSLITAIMARAAGKTVSTFSIGFTGVAAGLDESAHARTVARYLGTQHHELILPGDALGRVDELVDGLDEPIADSAILPTYLLAKFAREHVKVVLTGEGADEIFAGYNRYKAAYLSERLDRVPRWGRGLAVAVARRFGKGAVFARMPHRGLRAWAEANRHTDPETFTAVCRREFLDRAAHVDPWEWLKDPEEPHSLNGALAFDLRTVLADCLLMKVDKTTMRASLEARVPFLDRRLVEYAMHLPASIKIRRLKGKYLLRRLAAKYLPPRIAWRRKHGFVVPWEEWVRRPDNPALDDLLSSRGLEDWGVFDRGHLQWMRGELRGGSGRADAGLFFRVAILGLWLDALKRRTAC